MYEKTRKLLIKQLNITLVMGFFILYCSPKEESLLETNQVIQKYDVFMKKKLKNIQLDEMIQFSYVCKNKVSNIERKNLENTGITINSEIGKIFTAMGTKNQIEKLAALDFVLRLEAGKPVKLRENNKQNK